MAQPSPLMTRGRGRTKKRGEGPLCWVPPACQPHTVQIIWNLMGTRRKLRLFEYKFVCKQELFQVPPHHKLSRLQIINLLNYYCSDKSCWGNRRVSEVPFKWKVTFREQRAFPSWPFLFTSNSKSSKANLQIISNFSTGDSNDSPQKGLQPARLANKAPVHALHYLDACRRTDGAVRNNSCIGWHTLAKVITLV